MNALKGTGVALITPFDDVGNVDVPALERVVRYQIDNGIDYLVVLGTTGESVTLSKDEKQLVIDTVIEANQGSLPLVLGVGGNDTASVVMELKTRDLLAFDAVLSVSPMYNKPSQEGIYRHFGEIAVASPLPVILYNVPGRTASNMAVETVRRLNRDFKNIIGIKEAAGDIVQAMEMIRVTTPDFLVISGDDMITLPMVLAGGAGVISVIGEGFPAEFSSMVRLGLEGRSREAFEIHHKLAPVIEYIFEEGNPAGIKALLASRGLCGPYVRLPLVKASPDLTARIAEFVKSYSRTVSNC